jgi:hypothetical protein
MSNSISSLRRANIAHLTPFEATAQAHPSTPSNKAHPSQGSSTTLCRKKNSSRVTQTDLISAENRPYAAAHTRAKRDTAAILSTSTL